ncbi:MAG: FAD-dependent oxidoreductase [Phycisphaeraceae bacterium]
MKTDRLNHLTHEFDVCVVGGGMAGMCAAIAAARHGARTALVHDRPVFGGNASSEVRMWICGAHGPHNKETGLLEEIQLENQYRNAAGNYSIWDSVLYEKVFFEPNLTPFLNCSCTDAQVQGGRITSLRAWQLTSQTWHTIHAKLFVDCSGDSILAAVTGAEFRTGREARHEFDEDIEPVVGDARTMGNTLLIQLRRTDEPQPFVAPRWAYKFTSPDDLPHRMRGVHGSNFWWIEVGGLNDTIADAESIRDDLYKVAWGVWDYIKNRSPQRDEAENWALEFLGALPGKRENRRYVGDHMLTQHDVRGGGPFDDVVAFGGWSMDDHHPAGIYYPRKPTIFHPAPSPYGIPYRSLYSRNIANLLFAGRNISVTHAALSSTRVMATCAILGQAAGTAAALCITHDCLPRSLSTGDRLRQLQQTLMNDDCFLPGFTRQVNELAQAAKLSGGGSEVALLRDGHDRDRPDQPHAWAGAPGQALEYRWNHPVLLPSVRLVFDSNLNHAKKMPCTYPQKANGCAVPGTLVKRFHLDVQDASGQWRTVHREAENYQRLVRVPLEVQAQALRLIPEETWGEEAARLYSFEPAAAIEANRPVVAPGPRFADVRAGMDPADLAPPDSGLEKAGGKIAGSA